MLRLKKTVFLVVILSFMIIGFGCSSTSPVENAYDPSSFNVGGLKVNSDFEVDMEKRLGVEYKNLKWVPAGSLGKPNTDIEGVIELKNDLKLAKKEIDNVHEALMFINILLDVENSTVDGVTDDGIPLQFIKPVELTFESKRGVCADISSLVDYILDGDYEETGTLWGVRDIGLGGSGHVINYVKHKGNYYFFDVLGITKSNGSYPTENAMTNGQSHADWMDPVIKAPLKDYLKTRSIIDENTFYVKFKTTPYLLGYNFIDEKQYIPNSVESSGINVYLTKDAKWGIEKLDYNPKRPDVYKGYDIYNGPDEQNTNDLELNIDILDF